jgi:cytochrome c553
MTKTQIWVAAFLGMFILLFLLARFTRQEDNSSGKVSNPVPQTNMASDEVSTLDLMRQNGCMNCHGTELQGTQMAPPLAGLSQFWNRDKLINYLRNPSSYMDSDRFKAFKEKYPGTIMPPFNNLDVKDLGKIADLLLEK